MFKLALDWFERQPIEHVLGLHGPERRMGHREPATDRIFVRDLVLPVRVGAYAHERDRTQDVRFDVEVELPRPAQPIEQLRDTLSYDLIIDGIRTVVDQGHVVLVETLAERIAAHMLDLPRVLRVTIRVQKLEVGPGRVGVEITRERPG